MNRIMRNSSCGTLSLPSGLSCHYCESNIIKTNLKGIQSKRIKKCIRSFDERQESHREIPKVKIYNKINECIGNENANGDKLDTVLYILILKTEI